MHRQLMWLITALDCHEELAGTSVWWRGIMVIRDCCRRLFFFKIFWDLGKSMGGSLVLEQLLTRVVGTVPENYCALGPGVKRVTESRMPDKVENSALLIPGSQTMQGQYECFRLKVHVTRWSHPLPWPSSCRGDRWLRSAHCLAGAGGSPLVSCRGGLHCQDSVWEMSLQLHCSISFFLKPRRMTSRACFVWIRAQQWPQADLKDLSKIRFSLLLSFLLLQMAEQIRPLRDLSPPERLTRPWKDMGIFLCLFFSSFSSSLPQLFPPHSSTFCLPTRTPRRGPKPDLLDAPGF